MSLDDTKAEILRAAEAIGTRPPKVTFYANCVAVAFRNGDGDRVLITLPHDAKPDFIALTLQAAHKVKAENLPREDTLQKLSG